MKRKPAPLVEGRVKERADEHVCHDQHGVLKRIYRTGHKSNEKIWIKKIEHLDPHGSRRGSQQY